MEYGFDRILYPGQKKLIEDVTNAIECQKPCIVSSPTGTGKTLALLCAATRYISTQVSDDDDLFHLMNTGEKTKIYYCSRTHTQLSQVLAELKQCKVKYNAVILGSRKVYCINPEVSHIKDNDTLNEKCKEKIKHDACVFYKNTFYTSQATDIEDLKNLARKEVFCPYYHAKNKSSDCEIVFLPYNLLFTKEGRDSLNLSLKDKILIVDEAHNVFDTVIQLNSAEVSWIDLKNISNIKGLSKELQVIIERILNKRSTDASVHSVVDFLIDCKISNFNMLDISEFIEKNKLAQKNNMNSVFEFSKFLRFLTFSDNFGRVFISHNKIKFTCVNPKIYFEELKQCKSVIFAGGTMEPVTHLQTLFPDILYFSYPSVNNRFISLIATETINNIQINLTYEKRNALIDDVISTVIALANPIITGGVIVFVSSAQVLDMVKKSPKINNFTRKVYFEGSMSFEEFKKHPAILFAVMGGSLSEGINFSDNLCRLLIVLGVPYPTNTLEIEEKAKFLKDYTTLTAMKTVNQTVGRAVRHKNDYAAIVFLDARFIQLKRYMSTWIQNHTKTCKIGEAISQVFNFLKEAKEKDNVI